MRRLTPKALTAACLVPLLHPSAPSHALAAALLTRLAARGHAGACATALWQWSVHGEDVAGGTLAPTHALVTRGGVLGSVLAASAQGLALERVLLALLAGLDARVDQVVVVRW